MRLRIRVHGRPAPQGSKSQGGAGQLLEQSIYLPAWRRAVVIAAYESYAAAGIGPGSLPLIPARLPAYVEMCTFIVLPEQCRAEGTDEPVGPPDVDKLLRSTLDALGGARRRTARVYADDAQIVRCRDLGKVRATPDQPAGAIIIVSDGRE